MSDPEATAGSTFAASGGDVLLSEGPGGALSTIAMLECELELNGDVLRGWDEPARLTLQLELREQPGNKPPQYFGRLRIGREDWQPWQPAELAIGAPPVTAAPDD